jgi:hypothetical protein
MRGSRASRANARPARRATRPELARPLLWFFVAYASTSAYERKPRRLALALVSCWMARVLAAPTAGKLVAGPLFAAAGPLFESRLSSTGAFRYRRPDAMACRSGCPASTSTPPSWFERGSSLSFLPSDLEDSRQGVHAEGLSSEDSQARSRRRRAARLPSVA